MRVRILARPTAYPDYTRYRVQAWHWWRPYWVDRYEVDDEETARRLANALLRPRIEEIR